MKGAERLLPESVRLRAEAAVLARTGRELLLRAVALNLEAAELEDEATDLREARRVAGTDELRIAEERA